MKILSTNTLHIQRDLSAITDIGTEMSADAGGMTQYSVDKIWRACEALYRTGINPMLSICLRRQGQVVLNRSIGHTQASLTHPHNMASRATVDTPICLFSASKLVTAMLIHLLAERNLIQINDPVGLYLPEFAINGKQKTTINHLLTHRAGIARIPADIEPEMLFDDMAIYQRLCESKPSHAPGRATAYHALTSGYVLGELITRVTGKNPRQFLADTIEKPLNLPFFNYGLAEQYQPHIGLSMTAGIHPMFGADRYLTHVIGGNLQLAVDMTNDPRFLDNISPSANIFTTAAQMTRFLQMLLNGGTLDGVQIFKPETVYRAVKPANFAFDRSLLIPMRYGLGPMLGINPVGIFGLNTAHAFGHLGFSNNFCWADPARDISVSILTTGKAIVGTHVPALASLLTTIGQQCTSLSRLQRNDVFVG